MTALESFCMAIVDQLQRALVDFESVAIDDLERMEAVELDALAFGVIGLSDVNDVEIYNATESRLAGLRPSRVIGASYFDTIAPCMNNFLVALRFEQDPDLDEVIDYVLTLRMRPTKVKLRMLAKAGTARKYILIKR